MPRHIQGLPRPMNRARAMPVHITRIMIQPEIVPSPTYSRVARAEERDEGVDQPDVLLGDLGPDVHERGTPTAITPVVRWVDWSSTRWRIESTRRSVATRPDHDRDGERHEGDDAHVVLGVEEEEVVPDAPRRGHHRDGPDRSEDAHDQHQNRALRGGLVPVAPTSTATRLADRLLFLDRAIDSSFSAAVTSPLGGGTPASVGDAPCLVPGGRHRSPDPCPSQLRAPLSFG